MKNPRQMTAQPQRLVVRLALVATSVLVASLAPHAALAAPPATVATCNGIKSAYPILGTQCKNRYEQIRHAPANAGERRATFKARVAVLEIFRKALLCNGMYGANQAAQDSFRSEESAHLDHLENLRQAMENKGDPNVPAPYTADDLNLVTITKQQCK